jgi:hypothetical protein
MKKKMDGVLIQWTNDWWEERGEGENDKLCGVNCPTEPINYGKARHRISAKRKETVGFNQRISLRSRS